MKPVNVTAHSNLRLIQGKSFVFLPRLLKDFMELRDREPLNVRYDAKMRAIIIKKEKGVSGA